MQEMGLEPTRYCYHRHLKPARLPIPPLLHFYICCVLLSTKYILHDKEEIVNKKLDFFERFFLSGKRISVQRKKSQIQRNLRLFFSAGDGT